MTRTFLSLATVLAGIALSAPQTRACDTPVYRYAMYNWAPSDYRVFYLYRGEEAPEDQAVHTTLVEMAESSLVNLELLRIDAADAASLGTLPPAFLAALKPHFDGPLPIHVIVNPRGAVVFAGRLDEPELKRMVSSPARERVAKLLGEGHSGVFVFLPGPDERKNETALAELHAVVERAGKGLPAEQGLPTVADASEQDKIRVELVTLKREDSQEQWLTRMLHAVERLEPEDLQEPMTFVVYGRGRAMEPYIGRGITADNLMGVVAFVNGACSCEVKEQNPGQDLLTSWDWNESARTMAAKFGAETGNESLLEAALFGSAEPVEKPAAPATKVDGEEQATNDTAAPDPAATTIPPKSVPPATSQAVETTLRSRLISKAAWSLGIVAVALAVVSFVLIRRRPTS